VEQDEFPCECGAMVTIALGEREDLPEIIKTFLAAYCFDCGRQFNQLEIELILYHQRVLHQNVAEVS
jgi:hypothetical protein